MLQYIQIFYEHYRTIKWFSNPGIHMIQLRKNFTSLFVLLFFATTMQVQITQCTSPRTLKAFGFGAVTIIASFFNNKISRLKSTQWIASKTNTDAQDLADWCVLGPLCLSASYVCEHEMLKNCLQATAIIAPVIRIMATSNAWNTVLNNIPFIGRPLVCTDPACKRSVCNKCKYRLIYKEAPIAFILDVLPKILYQDIQRKRQRQEQQQVPLPQQTQEQRERAQQAQQRALQRMRDQRQRFAQQQPQSQDQQRTLGLQQPAAQAIQQPTVAPALDLQNLPDPIRQYIQQNNNPPTPTQQRVIDAINNPDHECNICMNERNLADFISACPQGHIYCRNCIAGLQRCPTCRAGIDLREILCFFPVNQ